jgi:hypothetical protein
MTAPDYRPAEPRTPRPPRSGPRHVVGPLILLSAGVLLLLNNLNVVPWAIWRDIWPYWPLLLVLLGLEAFISGRVAWGTLVLLAVALPIIGVAVSASDFAFRWDEATQARVGEQIPIPPQPLGGATSASVEVEYGAGALAIGPLPADAAADTLADGVVYGHQGLRFEPRSTMTNGRRTLTISPRDAGQTFDLGRLELRLSPNVPMDLKISSGVTQMSLDLETLQIPNLSIETGASKTQITLPAHGQTAATIEGGATQIDVRVPTNVAARIITDGGPNRFEIDEARFPKQGDEYRSPNFETAPDRVTLRISVGASRVTVQ